MIDATSEEAPWIRFDGQVAKVSLVSRSIVRVTCSGAAFADFADNGYDARIKLVLPLPDIGFDAFPDGPNWYEQWRALDPPRQNPIRTYTARAVRPARSELDIDLVLHGDGGPASTWAQQVQVGDPVCILGPNARFSGDHGGVEFKLPSTGVPILLAGDETALPAIATILEQLPETASGQALIEVPHKDDAIPLMSPPGIDIDWLVRGSSEHGANLLDRLERRVTELVHLDPHALAEMPRQGVENPDDQEEEPWDVPSTAGEQAIYAWIAGEAAMVRTARRLLVGELGIEKNAIAFMGYWKL